MQKSTTIEKHLKKEFNEFFSDLGSKRYFVEVKPRGHGFIAKIWVEEDILMQISEDRELISIISKKIREAGMAYNTRIFEELKPLF
ncbi:hypothetical protein Mzhil_0991 [Methanosalsum zhilinae DSM 4017]|uniref:Uncharacterized protein n=1 Tax=Methanosalsum zhilinae (strain DSM 4017 / NBRC 107636 / OCM 62 / WeN5) TaxID=679901 RepID=F7XLQ6_METZD|nr:hypothetical protein [Methanosalsum zhilinae]AEH60848.1 hypothetical protein Mzhil_0991 [Methanosalsum zhilinae DSM 4017]